MLTDLSFIPLWDKWIPSPVPPKVLDVSWYTLVGIVFVSNRRAIVVNIRAGELLSQEQRVFHTRLQVGGPGHEQVVYPPESRENKEDEHNAICELPWHAVIPHVGQIHFHAAIIACHKGPPNGVEPVVEVSNALHLLSLESTSSLTKCPFLALRLSIRQDYKMCLRDIRSKISAHLEVA